MAKSNLKKDPFRQALRSVVNDIIEENEGVIKKILEDIIEDTVMSSAIKRCKPKQMASREKIFATIASLTK